MSGEAFAASAAHASALMRRHGLTALVVDWVASAVLRFTALVLSAVVAVGGAAAVYWSASHAQLGASERTAAACAFGVAAWALSMSVLHFFASLLLDVVDAAYVCLSLEREAGHELQPQMGAALLSVCPVAQPDGQAAVAAPWSRRKTGYSSLIRA